APRRSARPRRCPAARLGPRHPPPRAAAPAPQGPPPATAAGPATAALTARTRGTPADRPRSQQPADRPGPDDRRADRQDPRPQHPYQARPARPRPSGDLRPPPTSRRRRTPAVTVQGSGSPSRPALTALDDMVWPGSRPGAGPGGPAPVTCSVHGVGPVDGLP